tara:strand:+ start:311 stop:448 length:138 start_codon:yes stop_codon:yes gene_type:complete
MNMMMALDIIEQWSKRNFATLAFLRTLFSFLKVVLAVIIVVEVIG